MRNLGRACVIAALFLTALARHQNLHSLSDQDVIPQRAPAYRAGATHAALTPPRDRQLLDAESDVWFESISQEELRLHWSEDDGSGARERLAWFGAAALDQSLEIRLVGFSGEGREGVRFSRVQIEQLLAAATHSPSVFTLNGTAVVRLARTVRVRMAKKSLSVAIARAVRRESPAVPVSIVDRIIREHYRARGTRSLVVYVLNPDVGADKTPYYYYHDEEDSQNSPCLGEGWVALFGDNKYVWFDTAAVVQERGSGSGSSWVAHEVLPSTLMGPALASEGSIARRTASVIALGLRMGNLAFTPPLDHGFPVPAENTQITVTLVRVDGAEKLNIEGIKSVYERVVEVVASLSVPGQHVTTTVHVTSAADCRECRAGLAEAAKNSGGENIKSVDGGVLLDRLAKANGARGSDRELRVYVFVLPLAEKLHLFAGNHPVFRRQGLMAVFENHKGTPRPGAASTPDFICRVPSRDNATMEQGIFNYSAVPARVTLAALLTAAYGIAPMYAQWNPFSGRAEKDYLLSTVLTPFGLFAPDAAVDDGFDYPVSSVALQPSFALRDAILRQALLSEFWFAREAISEWLQPFSRCERLSEARGEHVSAVLRDSTAHEHTLFVQRWNVLKFKLARGWRLAGTAHFSQAYLIFRSARHDARALGALLRRAGSRLRDVRPDCAVISAEESEAHEAMKPIKPGPECESALGDLSTVSVVRGWVVWFVWLGGVGGVMWFVILSNPSVEAALRDLFMGDKKHRY